MHELAKQLGIDCGPPPETLAPEASVSGSGPSTKETLSSPGSSCVTGSSPRAGKSAQSWTACKGGRSTPGTATSKATTKAMGVAAATKHKTGGTGSSGSRARGRCSGKPTAGTAPTPRHRTRQRQSSQITNQMVRVCVFVCVRVCVCVCVCVYCCCSYLTPCLLAFFLFVALQIGCIRSGHGAGSRLFVCQINGCCAGRS